MTTRGRETTALIAHDGGLGDSASPATAPHPALIALARLLGRRAALETLAEATGPRRIGPPPGEASPGASTESWEKP